MKRWCGQCWLRAKARTILAYYAPFERGQLLALADPVPHLRGELEALAARVGDLLVTIRDHVYHPAFGGSFSLKAVLPALVPELSYQDLTVADGRGASLQLETLLLHGDDEDAEARAQLRTALLAYCRLDTYGMVQLYERLRGLGA